jgi:pimeloyl-ACP methyl ester carboxylesterase
MLQSVDPNAPIGTRIRPRWGSVGGVTLAHDRAGEGPPLVLLHGIGMSKEVWRPVVPRLAREREVIAVDLPGFGASPPGPRTLGGLADAVAAFVASLGVQRPHVAGNSLGGGVALLLGARGHAQTVCAISPVGFAAGREWLYTRALLAATRVLAPGAPVLAGPRAARAVTCAHVVARPGRIPREDVLQWGRAAASAPSYWPLLRADWSIETPACPATVAWGERDWLLPFSRQAPRARRRLPSARHIVLRGCGHVPTWDDPEQVAHVLLEASFTGGTPGD